MESVLVVLIAMLVPIAGIVGSFIGGIKDKENERAIRQSIIENHVDAETAKLLISPRKKKSGRNYSGLYWGFILIFAGIGYLLVGSFGSEEGGPALFFIPGIGVGIGLLIAFVIHRRLEKKEKAKAQEETGQDV